MTKQEFLEMHARLRRSYSETGDNEGSVHCEGCAGCVDCVFCRDCRRCYRSRYSTACVDSSLLTHCEKCQLSHSLAYCQHSTHCGDSNYLVLCEYCFECDYCFGCVGLVKKDFHILNVKYSRSDYFRIVAQLRKELELPAPTG